VGVVVNRDRAELPTSRCKDLHWTGRKVCTGFGPQIFLKTAQSRIAKAAGQDCAETLPYESRLQGSAMMSSDFMKDKRMYAVCATAANQRMTNAGEADVLAGLCMLSQHMLPWSEHWACADVDTWKRDTDSSLVPLGK